MEETPRSPVAHVSLGDIDVAYRRCGTGPRLVLLHGLGQDHRIWDEVQDELGEFETIAYDLRGHGGTWMGDGDGTLGQLGRDLVAFLEFVGPAVCVGFSLGGSVALWAAAERPDLVLAVVAVATSSVVGRAAAASMDERIDEVAHGDASTIATILAQDTSSQLAGADVDVAALVASRVEAIGDGRGYLNGARAVRGMHDEPLNPRLDRIAQPVLVLSGSKDPWCPRRAADIMLEHLVNATFEELEGVGHLVTDVAPNELVSVVRTWLTSKEIS